MRFLVPAVLGLLVVAMACGGSDGPSDSPTIGNAETEPTPTIENAENEPTPTSEPTAPPATRDNAWALEQVKPLALEAAKALRDQRWNDLYDLYADPQCSRTEAVGAFIAASFLVSAFGGEELFEALVRDIEDGAWEPEIIEASDNRIVYQPADDDPVSVLRVDGDWQYEGDPCEDWETDDETQVEWDRLVDEWNQLSQGDRDSYIQGDQISGFDNWIAEQGHECATDDSGYSCTFESFSAQ